MLALIVSLALAAGVPTPPDLPVSPVLPVRPVPQNERVAEIRIQGNYRTAEADILKLAAINVGDPIQPDTVDAVRTRLEKSGKFDDVQVLKRWRTIDSTEDVVLVLIVREAEGGTTNPVGRAFHSLTHPLVLPVAGYVDGYGNGPPSSTAPTITSGGFSAAAFSGSGFTYGASLSPVNLVGRDTHVAIPLTWGATREAAFELDRLFAPNRPVTRVAGGIGIRQRTNPHYEWIDRRLTLDGRVERAFHRVVRVAGVASVSDVTFRANDDEDDEEGSMPPPQPPSLAGSGTLGLWGAEVSLDTRTAADLPRNAVTASFAIDRLQFEGDDVTRFRTDARGYVGLPLASVVIVRVTQSVADDALPGYEQSVLGGEESVRGFRPGYAADDNLLVGSAEWRVPFSSPLSFGKVGAALFIDSGAVYPHGTNFGDADRKTGVGGGLFLNATFFNFKLDAARGLDRGWRFHVLAGVSF